MLLRLFIDADPEPPTCSDSTTRYGGRLAAVVKPVVTLALAPLATGFSAGSGTCKCIKTQGWLAVREQDGYAESRTVARGARLQVPQDLFRAQERRHAAAAAHQEG
jgi:hypothetical protein